MHVNNVTCLMKNNCLEPLTVHQKGGFTLDQQNNDKQIKVPLLLFLNFNIVIFKLWNFSFDINFGIGFGICYGIGFGRKLLTAASVVLELDVYPRCQAIDISHLSQVRYQVQINPCMDYLYPSKYYLPCLALQQLDVLMKIHF